MKHSQPDVTIIGGGLAGSEAAWQCSRKGAYVRLYEMRPGSTTGAHITEDLAELVCSNSFGSKLPDHASGILLGELELLNSLLVDCAKGASLPAGNALAVDRRIFSQLVTDRIKCDPNIDIFREEVAEIPPGMVIIASGPLTSDTLARNISSLAGEDNLYFYDALAPIIFAESIDMSRAFRASRHGQNIGEQGDYINCPLSKNEYTAFITSLSSGERKALPSFDKPLEEGVTTGSTKYFEGCLPVEVLAARGQDALAYGPMRPIGLINPHDKSRPYAVAQLRQDNISASLYNMVGFQTNLLVREQQRIFRSIPGLEAAEFIRFGQMHRNTFLASPRLLLPTLQFRNIPSLLFAGQITGVEGYLGSIATGLLAGLNAARILNDQAPVFFPRTTMIGALCYAITHAEMRDYQPTKANLSLLPPLPRNHRISRLERAFKMGARARQDFTDYMNQIMKN